MVVHRWFTDDVFSVNSKWMFVSTLLDAIFICGIMREMLLFCEKSNSKKPPTTTNHKSHYQTAEHNMLTWRHAALNRTVFHTIRQMNY